MAYSSFKQLILRPSARLRPPLTSQFCFAFRNYSCSCVVFASVGGKRKHTKEPYSPFKRGVSTKKKGVFLDMDSKIDFNKKRMQGRDKEHGRQLKLKTKSINPVNTTCYLQILGTGMDTQDTSPAVLLFFDRQRFLFNVGEGFQRFSTEYKFKLSRLDHLFLTRVCSETAGGLPGLLLTLANLGDEGMTVNIWGPSDIEYLTGAMRSFIPHSAVLHTHSFHSNHMLENVTSTLKNSVVLIEDEIVRISAVILSPTSGSSSHDVLINNEIPGKYGQSSNEHRTATDISEREEGDSEKRWDSDISDEGIEISEGIRSSSKRHCSGIQNSERVKEARFYNHGSYKVGDVSVVYICELPEIKGKFNPEKAQELGLKPGPKYRELQLGKSVKSDRKNIMVHPNDVMGPSIPGPVVIVVDCPTVSHLPALLSTPAFNKFFINSNESKDQKNLVSCIVHLSPCSIINLPGYKDWMSKFGETQHIFAGHQGKFIEFPILRSSGRVSTQLNYLCPQLFPLPSNLEDNAAETSESHNALVEGSIGAENLLKFWLRPYSRLGLDRSSVPCLETASDVISKLIEEIPEIVDASKQIGQIVVPSNRQNGSLLKSMETEHCIHKEGFSKEIKHEADIKDEKGHLHVDVDQNQRADAYHLKCTDNNEKVPKCLENVKRDEMEIIFLGTGSSQPSKYRNVSGIYINLFSHGGILLDCGEGTLAQLKRRFGVHGADDAVKSLRFIWISHIHADHHCGLARILSLRKQLLKNEVHEPLLVIGPKPLRRFLNAYSRLEDLGMQFLDCRETTEDVINDFNQISTDALNQTEMEMQTSENKLGTSTIITLISKFDGAAKTSKFKPNRMQSYWERPDFEGNLHDVGGLQKLKRVLSEAGLDKLISVPVVHCPHSFAVVMQAQRQVDSLNKEVPGWKLAYSGDTRPCQALIDAASGATVLIHEATFDDSLAEEAISKNHSLTKEAIEVGVAARAYRIILTHFSQRYPKIPVFEESYTDRTCIAFDLMSINLADLHFVPKINPYLKLLFKNERALDEENQALEEENEKTLLENGIAMA